MAHRAKLARSRKIKKAPSFEEALQKLEEKKPRSSKQVKAKKAVVKNVKRKTAVKRSSRSKN